MESEPFADIWVSPVRERCTELALVLESQGIGSHVEWNGRFWVLSVPNAAATAAKLEIESYAAETRLSTRPPPLPSIQVNPWPAVGAYAAVLMALALAAQAFALGVDWFSAGRIDGAAVMNGELWRLVTALTLHADAAHLLGNLFFGAFFAYSVARYVGNGVGWMLIVVSGALGNLVNVLVSGAGHRSIGASTAVFAALGLLSAYCWRRGFPSAASKRERLAPVVAGIGLLAFTGAGGVNTDVGAHLFGFIAGFGGGLVIARVGVPQSGSVQRLAGSVAVVIVVAAWLIAVIAA